MPRRSRRLDEECGRLLGQRPVDVQESQFRSSAACLLCRSAGREVEWELFLQQRQFSLSLADRDLGQFPLLPGVADGEVELFGSNSTSPSPESPARRVRPPA